eukprot:CAMPEP_0114559274 /NCGR_PEP_ID=MMETSP0114-20121206/10835_1 /TAXON_ID=31324 /ORGANISM="Goniomonas sp, Strain m" /LENGTH=218 /DNA_ID=CAMNT_0001744735 /DNA_START=23 /DNA_END=679 /DNA_ORIENTATION=+
MAEQASFYLAEGGDLDIVSGTKHNFPGIDRIMAYPPPGVEFATDQPYYSYVAGGLQASITGALELVQRTAPEITAAYQPPTGDPFLKKNIRGLLQLRGLASIPARVTRWNLKQEHWEKIDALTGPIRGSIDRGSELVQEELQTAFRGMFAAVRTELRGLFGMNVAFVLLVFFGIFRQTVVTLDAEVARTRRFLSYMPLHLVNPQTVASIRNTFADEDD